MEKNEIDRLEKRLEVMRKEYPTSSPAYRKYLIRGASLIKHRLETLKREKPDQLHI